MKLFSFTRMGIYNSDPNWWDYNLSLFEAITLPSMSQAIHDPEDFWILLVNKISPIEAVRRLNTMIRNSPIRGNTYILYDNYAAYWSDQNKIHSDFVKQHVEPGEFFIKHQIDSDDAIAYDMFDEARRFVKQKVDELGVNSRLVFTLKNCYLFELRAGMIRHRKHAFCSFNGFTYDSNCLSFPWIHQLQYTANKNKTFFVKNNYSIFEVDTDQKMACYFMHGASTLDIKLKTQNKQRALEHEYVKITDFGLLLRFGVTQASIDFFLSKYPEPLAYYESRQDCMIPFKKSIDHYRLELLAFYQLEKQALDYIDIEKKTLREKIMKICLNEGKTWLSAITKFYEIDITTNNHYTSIQDGQEYLKKLSTSHHVYAIAYKGEICFVLYCFKGEIVIKKDSSFCRILFSSDGIRTHDVWIKSIIENGNSITSIAYRGLEYSMNKEGLNIVVFEGGNVIDSVNINQEDNFRLTRLTI